MNSLVLLDGLASIVAVQCDPPVTLGVLLHFLLPRHVFHPVRSQATATIKGTHTRLQQNPPETNSSSPEWDRGEVEIKVLSTDSPEVAKALFLKSGVSQSIALICFA